MNVIQRNKKQYNKTEEQKYIDATSIPGANATERTKEYRRMQLLYIHCILGDTKDERVIDAMISYENRDEATLDNYNYYRKRIALWMDKTFGKTFTMIAPKPPKPPPANQRFNTTPYSRPYGPRQRNLY